MQSLTWTLAVAAFAAAALMLTSIVRSEAGRLAPYQVVGDAIPAPLAGAKGNAARGLDVIRDRRTGNCLICHALKLVDEPFQGEIAPGFEGVGSRLSPGQIRLRIVDAARLNPATVMPPYYRVEGLTNVAVEYRGLPALDAQQIEDIVVYLSRLKE
jgi:L-cysteine S-thiosulfotransferase